MWQAVAAVIALVGLLATSNVVVGAHVKARRRLSEELDLLSKIPKELGGRAVFEEYLNDSIDTYVGRGRPSDESIEELQDQYRRTTRWHWVGLALAVVSIGGLLSQHGSGTLVWLSPWLYLGITGNVIQGFAARRMSRSRAQIRTRRAVLAAITEQQEPEPTED
jgi:hypothetical protein